MSSSRTPGKTGSSQLTESAQPGGAAGSDPGDGGKRSNVGGATGSQGKTGCRQLTESTQPGGATGRIKSVDAWPDPDDKVRFSQPSGGEGSNLGGATGSQTRNKVKNENGGDFPSGFLQVGHLHHFTVKFSRTDCNEYAIDCDEPRTVLEAIQSTEQYWKMKMCPDENIVIQLGKKDKKYTIATHFPCSCIGEGESLVISFGPEKVEVTRDQLYRPIQSRDKYSVFNIDTIGGKNTKTKKLFRSNFVKEFKYLCVYGEKGMTVKEALERDGRFVEDLGDFTLSDNNDSNRITEKKQKVDNLDKKKFKICLPRNKTANDSSGLPNNSPQRSDTTPAVDEAQQTKIRALIEKRGISVRAAMEKSGNNVNIEEIYKTLRHQFPKLKAFMESRFPGDSYQKAVNRRKENFGKIEQSFSEVHRVKKLLKLGESVCKVVVKNGSQGTGFVLFDNFILTNAHLFDGCVEGQKLKEGIDVFVLFNYDDPEPHLNYYYYELAHRDICYTQDELDYAVLELNPESQKSNQSTQTQRMKVPPGLLKMFGPMPQNGEACIIGHPAGGVKKMDPTFIIEKEKREQAVNDQLPSFEDRIFTILSIDHLLKDQGIENIMTGGKIADKVETYNTFMYHGSSGSPVFDARGRVFGLHTAGFVYGFPNHQKSVIEFAQRLLTIFEHFKSMLKEHGKVDLLKRVERLKDEPADPEELLDYIEGMDTD